MIWIPCNTLFIVFKTSPVVVISFITAVMAFYIMYFLPVMMTLKAGDYFSKAIRRSEPDADPSIENKLINQEREQSTDSSNEETEKQLSIDNSANPKLKKW